MAKSQKVHWIRMTVAISVGMMGAGCGAVRAFDLWPPPKAVFVESPVQLVATQPTSDALLDICARGLDISSVVPDAKVVEQDEPATKEWPDYTELVQCFTTFEYTNTTGGYEHVSISVNLGLLPTYRITQMLKQNPDFNGCDKRNGSDVDSALKLDDNVAICANDDSTPNSRHNTFYTKGTEVEVWTDLNGAAPSEPSLHKTVLQNLLAAMKDA